MSNSSRCLLLQLPRDILHIVYSEWLSSLQDLSSLDIGCIEKRDREIWLSSLNELKIIISMMKNWKESIDKISKQQVMMRKWYRWLMTRKVYLLGKYFPVSLWSLLSTNLLEEEEEEIGLDNYYQQYCSTIQSIEIDLDSLNNKIGYYPPIDPILLTRLEERFDFFLRECHYIKEIRFNGSERHSAINDLIFTVLRKRLEPNILQTLSIHIESIYYPSTEKLMVEFIIDHILTLQDFELMVEGVSEEYVNRIMNLLYEKNTNSSSSPLKRLSLSIDPFSWKKVLISLPSSSSSSSSIGLSSLEILEIQGETMIEDSLSIEDEEEVLSSIGRACPHLKSLRLSPSSHSSNKISIRKLSKLYELCSNLISFVYSSLMTISVNNDRNELQYSLGGSDNNNTIMDNQYYYSRDEKEVFLDCVCLAIERSSQQCSLIVSNQSFCYNLVTQYDDWVLFKSKLSPYLTELVGIVSESIIIEALKELPRLQTLDIKLDDERFSDVILSAIRQYGPNRLKSLYMYSLRHRAKEQCYFSDELMSEMITSCNMLENLIIPGAGYESIVAIKHHSRLKEVHLFCVEVWKDEISTLLELDEREREEKKCIIWRRLQKGKISGIGFTYNYIKEERYWELS